MKQLPLFYNFNMALIKQAWREFEPKQEKEKREFIFKRNSLRSLKGWKSRANK